MFQKLNKGPGALMCDVDMVSDLLHLKINESYRKGSPEPGPRQLE